MGNAFVTLTALLDLLSEDLYMRKFTGIFLIIFALAVFVPAQRLGKPTLTASKPTETQEKTLREGVVLHDAKKYDEAIAKYRSILADNPDCARAMYELAFSLDQKGDKREAIEVAYKGTKYISDDLALFYAFIANNLDDLGKSDDAIKIYRDGLKALEGDKQFGSYRSSLFFNLGVTYLKQKNYKDAREALKSAVENNFAYASPHYLLAVVFEGTKYKVPALLAAARFISLEFNTARTANSVEIVKRILPPAKDPGGGNIKIFLDLNAPKDEGDFGMFDLILGTITTVRGDDDKNKSDNQMYIEGLGSIIAMLEEDKKISETFVGKTYVPFMVDMKKKGHLETFGNILLFLQNKKNAQASSWLDDNGPKVKEFLAWAKSY
jgi:tetratricopeptide (TPR) repeat protein